MIADPLTVSPTTVARVLNEFCDTVARGERPLTSYSAIAGKDGNVSVEHAYVGPEGAAVPPRIETTVYVPARCFDAGTTLQPASGDAPSSAPVEADGDGDEPSTLAAQGEPGAALVETISAIAASTGHLAGYSDDGDGFDPVCTEIYPPRPDAGASVAFRGYLEIDELIATRRSATPRSTV